MANIKLEAKRGRAPERLRFVRFTPRQAIRELSSQTPAYLVSKPYAAFSLIFWAFLDGRPGKRTDTKKKPIYTSDARRAGNIFFAFRVAPRLT
jgi:hypothetical protein